MFQQNTTYIRDGLFFKEYGDVHLHHLPGMLQRKPLQSARSRFRRERDLTRLFSEEDINTNRIVDWDGSVPMLVAEAREILSLEEVLAATRHPDDRAEVLREGLETLHAIHELGEYHGDALIKNFHREDNGKIFVTDFEIARDAPDPRAYDLLLYTASARRCLGDERRSDAFLVAGDVYGSLPPFDFTMRDRLYFSVRFGADKNFFDMFKRKRYA